MVSNRVQQWLEGARPAGLDSPRVGALLVAMPVLGDPTFDHTVVMLVGDYDGGYQGVILSDPSNRSVRVSLRTWWRMAMPPRTFHRGGPCDPELVLCLAVGRPGLKVEGLSAVQIYAHQTLYRVDGDVTPDDILPHVEGIRMFCGYAGWEPGQLEGEIASGAWLVVPSQPDDAVSSVSATLWRRVLERQLGDAAFLRTCPENPLRN